MREVSEALGRGSVTLCHCGIASRSPVAVPEAGGPCRGAPGRKGPYPVVWSGRHSQDSEALPCSATGSCTLLGRPCCAVVFGGGREQGGGWEMTSFSVLSRHWETIQIKSLLTETFPPRTHLSPSGEPPGISDASSQPRSAYEITAICEPRDAKMGKYAY